jgi:hypothetical protein
MRDGGLAERPSENVIRVKYLRGNLDFQPIKRTVDPHDIRLYKTFESVGFGCSTYVSTYFETLGMSSRTPTRAIPRGIALLPNLRPFSCHILLLLIILLEYLAA